MKLKVKKSEVIEEEFDVKFPIYVNLPWSDYSTIYEKRISPTLAVQICIPFDNTEDMELAIRRYDITEECDVPDRIIGRGTYQADPEAVEFELRRFYEQLGLMLRLEDVFNENQ